MNNATLPILVAIMIQLALGLVVFQSNPKRKPNQCFLFLSFTIGAWLGSLYFALSGHNDAIAEFSIRAASVAAAVIFAAFNLLRLSIREGQKGWRGILGHSRSWLVATAGIVVLCQTNWFLQGVRWSNATHAVPVAAPTPVYGRGVIVYEAYFICAIVLLITGTARDLRRTRGGERAELGFVLIGGIAALLLSLPLALILGSFFEPSQMLWFAPFRVLLFSVVVAYGIATRKIMEVGLFLRTALSYLVLSAYLLILYAIVWWLVVEALHVVAASRAHEIAHITAAIVIAFAMAPARGISQKLAERLFISSHRLDFQATVSKATGILSSVTTLRDLLRRFADTIAEAVRADRVSILLHSREGYMTRYAAARSGEPEPHLCLAADNPITTYLRTHREPVVLEELHRIRPTPEVQAVAVKMRGFKIAVAMGIFSREQLVGIMLLGPRTSGRIYGSVEQAALQVLCGQLAVAIENAELFTEVQNAKNYNETLLQNLTTGVIAAGTDERITVFNNEAGQITEMDAHDMLDRPIEELTEPLRDSLRKTLQTGESQNNELVLRFGDRGIVVRASASIFHGEDRQVLGALMVFTDITNLKRLELQIRRSDRLASLGTLSAGMAHEIKNPLVSIKTFAQLLPERYQDSDFRDTFSSLIGHEIDRIDSLVNQLLRFARPAKPHLKPLHVHEILEKSLLLVGHRLYQKDIKLTRSWLANVDTIRADSDQLEQVFLNFFINAMDAMKSGGELNVSTEIGADAEWATALAQSNGDAHDFVRITIRDSGEGIRSEDIAHVFDPFFTTKDYGTGLGLSVVHGIIQEHGGQIEVESELKKGTSFHIMLPVVRFDSEVAAA